MTPPLSSQWINAWLNVLSTSILLAGKEDLFDIENTLYCESSCGKRDSFTQYYQYILIKLQFLPVLRTRRGKKEHDTLSCAAVCRALLAAFLSHLITWFRQYSRQNVNFSLFSGLGPFHVFLSTGYFPSYRLMLHFCCNISDGVWWRHVMSKLHFK